jgi:hypothetical protein
MQFDKVKLTSSFTGKKGSIATVATGRIYDLAFGIGDVWEGTWKIVKSTDSYEGIRGGGIWKGADDRPHHTLFTKYAGIVATP